MTSQSFDRTLRGFQRRRPFRSFTVELVSGDRFRVEHPEALTFRGGVAVYISARGDLRLFDHEGVSQLIDNGKRSSN